VELPTVTELITPLVDVDDRGVYLADEALGRNADPQDSFTSWRDHIRHGAAVAATLRARLDPDRPPHVGVLLQNTPFFSALLVAAGLSGIVPVGLNPIRRGAALARDVSHADCQVVLADSAMLATVGEIDCVNVDSAQWAAEVEAYREAPVAPRATGHQRRPQGGQV
jgi:fatty-acyl-CoA synthase